MKISKLFFWLYFLHNITSCKNKSGRENFLRSWSVYILYTVFSAWQPHSRNHFPLNFFSLDFWEFLPTNYAFFVQFSPRHILKLNIRSVCCAFTHSVSHLPFGSGEILFPEATRAGIEDILFPIDSQLLHLLKGNLLLNEKLL